jgi:hypothetical protein
MTGAGAKARAKAGSPIGALGNDGKLRVKGDGIYAGCLLNSDLLRLIPLEPL